MRFISLSEGSCQASPVVPSFQSSTEVANGHSPLPAAQNVSDKDRKPLTRSGEALLLLLDFLWKGGGWEPGIFHFNRVSLSEFIGTLSEKCKVFVKLVSTLV